jgi:hypothetical protein
MITAKLNKLKIIVLAITLVGGFFVSHNNASATTIDGSLDLHQATILNNPSDLANWAVTTTITGIDLTPDGVHVDFDKKDGAGSWPEVLVFPPDGKIQYTLGMAEKINGKWYASAPIELWKGLDKSGGPPDQYTRNWFYAADRWAPMTCHTLVAGETIGFFVVAGDVRNNTSGDHSPVKERSDIVLVKMPVNGLPCQTSTGNPTPTPVPSPTPTPAPTICTDTSATNVGGALPCKFPPAPNCEPWPSESEQIAACVNYLLEHPQPKPYPPGTDPNHPSGFTADGISGIAAAYSPKIDSTIVVAGKIVSGDDRELVGYVADPQTLVAKSPAFRVDRVSGDGTSGGPHIAYAEDLDKFLVVWSDYRACDKCLDIYGRFISAEGAPIGADFLVVQVGSLDSVTYDPTSKKFVIDYENDGVFLKTIDATTGAASGNFKLQNYFLYQGQSEVAFDTHTNEYIITYATVVARPDKPDEDDRIYYSRVDAKTLKVIGEPVQLSTTRPGRLAVQGAHIAYSPEDGAAVAMWLERGRDGTVAGVWGRTIYDDGTLSNEYPIITNAQQPYSGGYQSSSIVYNQYTNTFFVGSGDWDGNAWITEFDSSGTVYDSDLAVAVSGSGGATGSYNVTTAATKTGSATFTSRNYRQVVGTSKIGLGSAPTPPPTPTPPTPPGKINIGGLGIYVNQIYIWSLSVAAILALLMIVFGGYITLTSAGNAERASRGKSFILSSLIGLVLLFGSYILLRTINPDLVDFSNNQANQVQQQ